MTSGNGWLGILSVWGETERDRVRVGQHGFDYFGVFFFFFFVLIS